MSWSKALGILLVFSALAAVGMVNDTTTPDNPFEKDPIVISTESNHHSESVEQAISYWNKNNQIYGNWSANLTYVPNAESPDVMIRFVEDINRCGTHTDIITDITGCAPRLDKDDDIDDFEEDTIEIKIVDNRKVEYITSDLKHELGHIHGIKHGMEPMPLMNATVRRPG